MISFFKLSPVYFNLARIEAVNQKIKKILTGSHYSINTSKTFISKLNFRNKICEAFENDGNDDNIISHEYVMLELPEKHATFGNNISKQFDSVEKIMNDSIIDEFEDND
uniref:DDE_Tnp_ISL3 domain-containing protein n=1 Tax=Strongyloides venezuelensis TaxID=75913 RepID=A0A0K0FRB8_STRVS